MFQSPDVSSVLSERAQGRIELLGRQAPTGLKPAPNTNQDHAHWIVIIPVLLRDNFALTTSPVAVQHTRIVVLGGKRARNTGVLALSALVSGEFPQEACGMTHGPSAADSGALLVSHGYPQSLREKIVSLSLVVGDVCSGKRYRLGGDCLFTDGSH